MHQDDHQYLTISINELQKYNHDNKNPLHAASGRTRAMFMNLYILDQVIQIGTLQQIIRIQFVYMMLNSMVFSPTMLVQLP